MVIHLLNIQEQKLFNKRDAIAEQNVARLHVNKYKNASF